jgi:hypothetical protein
MEIEKYRRQITLEDKYVETTVRFPEEKLLILRQRRFQMIQKQYLVPQELSVAIFKKRCILDQIAYNVRSDVWR